MAATIRGNGRIKSAMKWPGRVIRLLLGPAKEFARIAPEPETARAVITGWIVPLVLIMVVANFTAAMMFGIELRGTNVRLHLTIGQAPTYALPVFVQSVLMPLVTAIVINILAGFFGGQRNYVQAVRTAAYAGTPAWLVGLFGPAWVQAGLLQIIPPLSVGLVIGAFWSIYLLYRGLSPMMKSPPGKSLLYTIVVVAIMFVAWRFALHLTFDTITYLNGGSGDWFLKREPLDLSSNLGDGRLGQAAALA